MMNGANQINQLNKNGLKNNPSQNSHAINVAKKDIKALNALLMQIKLGEEGHLIDHLMIKNSQIKENALNQIINQILHKMNGVQI